MNIKVYPPADGFTASEVRAGHHWLYADVKCPHCGKEQSARRPIACDNRERS